jgi:hypothetical protein
MGKEKTQFKPGNPGKPKGAKNKIHGDLRDRISEFLSGEFVSVIADFKMLDSKDKLKFYTDLLQYGLPKLQATSLEIDIDNITEESIDKIIDRLLNTVKCKESKRLNY